MSNAPKNEWTSTRFWLALGITVISVIAVAVLAGLVIRNSAGQAGSAASAQNVLSSVLPLLGTWVGTILAYYFSKENFEAATKSVTDLARQITPQEKLRAVLAKDKMIPRNAMFYRKLPASSLKLTDLLEDLEKERKGNRVPVIGEGETVAYIFHRSMIDRFLSSAARSGKSPTEISALTIEDLLASEGAIAVAEAFGAVASTSTLADAMDIMNSVSECQDVFVTQTGKKDGAVIGWVTNNIVQENAKI